MRVLLIEDDSATAQSIELMLKSESFNVYTTEEERTLLLEGRLQRMSGVLGLFRALLVMVSIVIIALIVYVLTIEKIKSIATLKLIGAPDRTIIGLIVQQALILGASGLGIGLALILGIDRFMSEARALTNLIGNGVATLVVARYCDQLDEATAQHDLFTEQVGFALFAEVGLDDARAPAADG